VRRCVRPTAAAARPGTVVSMGTTRLRGLTGPVVGLLVLVGLLVAPPILPRANATGAGPTLGEVLAGLVVAEEHAPRRYARTEFRHWVDADRDCQDTRVEVLVRDDLGGPTSACRITTGRWYSWLDGVTVTSSRSLDVDHLVALGEAWYSGAHAWTTAQREAFANDLGYRWSLQAVTASSNRSKSDRDPAEWLPAAQIHCDYAGRWMAVKTRWSLSVDRREHEALRGVLDRGRCTDRRMELPPRIAGLPSPTGTPANTSSPTTSPPKAPVRPGSFCSPAGAVGADRAGVRYTCKPGPSDARNRWRR